MEPKTLSLNHQSVKAVDWERSSSRINIGAVFKERMRESYLNEFALFTAFFNAIPNFIHEINIDCRKANIWFADEYKCEIHDSYFRKLHFNERNKVELSDVFYFMYEDLIVGFDICESKVRFLFKKTEINRVNHLIQTLKKFKNKPKRKPEISLLVTGSYSYRGFETKSMKITKPRLNIDDNYNDDFKEVHQTILRRLSSKNNKGLVILHGKPGTGKTSYIRYLLSSIKKKIIFLPPNMATAITNPDLIPILIKNPNSIFVIEDAENIIMDREKNGHSPVSALLNISDGLLADCLNIQVICSFNTDISKVDSALLRKGRLIAKYEFKELEVQKAQSLSIKLGFDTTVNCPMTLTAIYNQEEKDFQQTKRKVSIGFLS
jgi:hypothetical protein